MNKLGLHLFKRNSMPLDVGITFLGIHCLVIMLLFLINIINNNETIFNRVV